MGRRGREPRPCKGHGLGSEGPAILPRPYSEVIFIHQQSDLLLNEKSTVTVFLFYPMLPNLSPRTSSRELINVYRLEDFFFILKSHSTNCLKALAGLFKIIT